MRVLDAQVALERLNLRQLDVLRNQGHASWLESARKRTDIDTLNARLIAARRTVELVQELSDRAEQIHYAADAERLPGDQREPLVISLSLPGSLRVVGWLDAEQVCRNTRSKCLTTLRELSGEPAKGKKCLALAEKRDAECANKIADLEKLHGSAKAAHDLQWAKLELAVARAQLELTRIVKERQEREWNRIERLEGIQVSSLDEDGSETESRSHYSSVPAGLDPTCVTCDSDSALWLATLRIAAAEANQTGALRAANVRLQRSGLAAQAFQQLQEHGLATRRELERAREKLDDCEFEQQRLLDQRSRLEFSYALLRGASGLNDVEQYGNGAPVSSPDASSNSLNGEWTLEDLPVSCFTSGAAVSYLIELARMGYETEAECQSISAERELLQHIETKLRKADKISTESQEDAGQARWHDELSGLLSAGRLRERQNIRLDIELAEAQLLAARERLQIIRLEWQRFGHQMRCQSDVGTGSVRRVGYVESLPALQLASMRQSAWARSAARSTFVLPEVACHPTAPLRDCPIGYPTWLQRQRWMESCVTARRIGGYFCPVPLCFPYQGDSWRLTTRWHVPSYADYYAFGIRRTDFRAAPSTHGRATSYGGPWYFPGAPTNFRE